MFTTILSQKLGVSIFLFRYAGELFVLENGLVWHNFGAGILLPVL
jgi:hypothetical protein